MTASGVEQAPVVSLEAVETLGIRVNQVKVACLDLPEQSRVIGLLGLSFLRETIVSINFKEGLLDLMRP